MYVLQRRVMAMSEITFIIRLSTLNCLNVCTKDARHFAVSFARGGESRAMMSTITSLERTSAKIGTAGQHG